MIKQAEQVQATQETGRHVGLVEALIAAQREFRPAIKDSVNPHFRSRYVDLAGAVDACQDALGRHGLAVIQATRLDPAGIVVLVTELAHVSGESRTSEYPLLPAKDRDPQALGGALTYARRYSLMAIAGLAPEDDDGETASGRGGPPAPKAPQPVRSAPPLAPPAASSTAPAASPAQVRSLNIAITALGLASRDEKLRWLSAQAGRAVESSRDLGSAECERLTAAARAGEVAADTREPGGDE